MTIMLFGVSNVGKTTTGKILAKRLDFEFYDIDAEVKNYYHTTLEEFVKKGTIKERDYKRGLILQKLFKNPESKVISVTPMSNPEYFLPFILMDDVSAIELVDSPENIFDRLVFSDENDCIYKDDDYKNAHKEYYLNDIRKDLEWYGLTNYEIKTK